MPKYTSPLAHVRVAAPCSASWEGMSGNETVRMCAQCNLNVYNLSGMTKRQAEALITNTEGRLCVRYFRRADGTILTNNCPVGLRALKRRVSRMTTALLTSVLGFFAGVGINFAFFSPRENVAPPVERTMGTIAIEKHAPPLMGNVNIESEMGKFEVRGKMLPMNSTPDNRGWSNKRRVRASE